MATQKDDSKNTTATTEQDAWQGFESGRWQTDLQARLHPLARDDHRRALQDLLSAGVDGDEPALSTAALLPIAVFAAPASSCGAALADGAVYLAGQEVRQPQTPHPRLEQIGRQLCHRHRSPHPQLGGRREWVALHVIDVEREIPEVVVVPNLLVGAIAAPVDATQDPAELFCAGHAARSPLLSSSPSRAPAAYPGFAARSPRL